MFVLYGRRRIGKTALLEWGRFAGFRTLLIMWERALRSSRNWAGYRPAGGFPCARGAAAGASCARRSSRSSKASQRRHALVAEVKWSRSKVSVNLIDQLRLRVAREPAFSDMTCTYALISMAGFRGKRRTASDERIIDITDLRW